MDLIQLAADRRAMLALVDALAFCREIGELPHEGQIPILSDRHRFQVVCCGARFGKSWSAGKWAAARMMVPGTRGWCVSGTYDLADKVYREVFGIFRRHGRALGVGIKRHVGNDKTQQTLELTNGSTLCTKSADHPDSLDAEGQS